MTHPAPPIIIGLICFMAFIFFFATGIKLKRLSRFVYSLGFLLLTIFCFLWLSFIVAGKVYKKVKNVVPDEISFLKPREPFEAYKALFGAPNDTCVKTINFTDQIVPRLDCCIWLEFKTCPSEIRRIISLNSFKISEHASSDTLSYLPTYSPMPYWWTPHSLGPKVIVFQDDTNTPNRDKILILSIDSSHAFYCDMAD